MSDPVEDPHLKLRLVFGSRGMIGPGKAELLERIDRTGSIAAAGREMGMSYKRAWMLVHFGLGDFDFLAPEIRERNIGNVIVFVFSHGLSNFDERCIWMAKNGVLTLASSAD